MATTEEATRAAANTWTFNGNGADGGGPLGPAGANLPAPQEEDFDDQPMTLVDHLKELRDRLIRACLAILVGMGAGFFFTQRVMEYFRSVVERTPGARLIQTEATEYISTYLKVTMYLGIAFAMPILVYQFIRFLAPGLTRTERRYVYASLPFAMLFFVGGVAFASLVAIPNMYHFLLGFSAGNVENLIRVGDVLGFFSSLSIWTGVFFEMPVVMFLLSALGIVGYDVMRKARKFASVGLMIVAAVITPAPDALSMLVIWAPMYLLFELGLILARFAPRRRQAATAP